MKKITGKRNARTIYAGGKPIELRWYVSGRIYRRLPFNNDNLMLSVEWLWAGRAA